VAGREPLGTQSLDGSDVFAGVSSVFAGVSFDLFPGQWVAKYAVRNALAKVKTPEMMAAHIVSISYSPLIITVAWIVFAFLSVVV